jgi:hypothetical protein
LIEAVGSGRLAQLVEHLVYTERVGGSSPSPPTISGKSKPSQAEAKLGELICDFDAMARRALFRDGNVLGHRSPP